MNLLILCCIPSFVALAVVFVPYLYEAIEGH